MRGAPSWFPATARTARSRPVRRTGTARVRCRSRRWPAPANACAPCGSRTARAMPAHRTRRSRPALADRFHSRGTCGRATRRRPGNYRHRTHYDLETFQILPQANDAVRLHNEELTTRTVESRGDLIAGESRARGTEADSRSNRTASSFRSRSPRHFAGILLFADDLRVGPGRRWTQLQR